MTHKGWRVVKPQHNQSKKTWGKARETENCQSVKSFLAALTEFAESFSAAFTEFNK